MEVRLHVVQGKANVKEIVLGRETLIGRGSECNLKIASSQVSRRHCRIVVTDDRVLMTDLGSANGTLVEGQPLTPNTPTPVGPNVEVEIGPLKFAVRFSPPAGISPASDDTARNPDTVKSDRAVPRKGSESETVDYVPDERRKRELREAVARATASSKATLVAPGETVMDLNLSPAPKPERESETFHAPPVASDRPDETVELPDEGIATEPISAVNADEDDDVVELPPAQAEDAGDSDADLKTFLSNFGR
jgi:predicted component of type VI protein secretion system